MTQHTKRSQRTFKVPYKYYRRTSGGGGQVCGGDYRRLCSQASISLQRGCHRGEAQRGGLSAGASEPEPRRSDAAPAGRHRFSREARFLIQNRKEPLERRESVSLFQKSRINSVFLCFFFFFDLGLLSFVCFLFFFN